MLVFIFILSLSATCNQCVSSNIKTDTQEETSETGQDIQSQSSSSSSQSGNVSSVQNHNPVINSIRVSEGTIFCRSTVDVWVDAIDEDGDNLSYKWDIAGGDATIEEVDSAHTTWIAPSSPTGVKIIVGVIDGKGGYAESAIDVSVVSFSGSNQQQQEENAEVGEDQDQQSQQGQEQPQQTYGDVDAGSDAVFRDSMILGCDMSTYFQGQSVSGCMDRSRTRQLSGNFVIGDYYTNNSNVEFISFNISPLKNLSNLNITRVEININNIMVQGDPSGFAQYLRFKYYEFSTLDGTDYNAIGTTFLKDFELANIGSSIYFNSDNCPALIGRAPPKVFFRIDPNEAKKRLGLKE